MFDNQTKPKGVKRIYRATLNSFNAFKWLLKNESAFKQEVLLLVGVLPLSLLLNVSSIEKIILIASVFFIILVEVINTAIEAIVDRIGLEIHPLSGLAKDLGSAAVLLSFVIALFAWGAILL